MITMPTLVAIQNGFSFVVALSVWFTLVFLCFKVKKPDQLTHLTMLYLGTYALGMTFEVEAIYLAFDAWVGVPNLSWLIAWIGITTSTYFITCVFYKVRKTLIPLWLHISLSVCLLIYLMMFLLGISHSSEWPSHVVPRNAFDFVFMETIFVFGALNFLVIAVNEAHIYLNEKALVGRIRWGIAIIISIGAAIFFVLRIILTLWSYLYPESSAIVGIYTMALMVQIFSGSLISLPFLPTHLLLYFARPLIAVDKLWGLKKLEVVQASLDSFFPPVVPQQMSWWEVIKNINFYEYRTLISILDSKTMLSAYLEAQEFVFLERNQMIMFRAGDDLKAWDKTTQEKAATLFKALQNVNDNLEFDELVQAYRQLGLLLQQKRK